MLRASVLSFLVVSLISACSAAPSGQTTSSTAAVSADSCSADGFACQADTDCCNEGSTCFAGVCNTGKAQGASCSENYECYANLCFKTIMGAMTGDGTCACVVSFGWCEHDRDCCSGSCVAQDAGGSLCQ